MLSIKKAKSIEPILLEQNVIFWEGAIGKSTELELYQDEINRLLSGDTASVNFKKLAGPHEIYRIKTNKKERLIFTIVEREGKQYLALLDVMKDHNYKTSKFLKPQVDVAPKKRTLN